MPQVYSYKTSNEPDRWVFVATPTYTGSTAPAYHLSMLRSIDAAVQAGIGVEWCLLAGNCHVDDARNYLVREFLDSSCDQMFFIDADVGWDANDFVRLVECEHSVAAGIYPKKNDDSEYPVRFVEGAMWTDKNGWLEVDKVPTGFLKIRRYVLQQMYDAEPRKFNSQQEQLRTPQAIIFERTYYKGLRTSGDFAFSKKWRDSGGKIFIDPEMRFIHDGTKEYSGKVGHFLRKTNGLLDNYIGQILGKVESGEYEEKDLIDLYEAWDDNRWAANPDVLVGVALLAEENKGNVLELGAGLSTLVLGAIAKRKGFNVVSVEHDSTWYRLTQKYLDLYEYAVELKLCPIKDSWYNYKPDRAFDFVFIDGPPRQIGRSGVKQIQGSFNDGCLLVLDDYSQNLSVTLDNVKFKPYRRFAIGVKENDSQAVNQ